MDYFDILLARNLANKGDITTESLSVTANGTYTAPSGKAYTPVNVNVPLPSNAYLLKTVSGLPASIASFTASDAPLDSLKVSIEAVQSGSGEPSPQNVRPISGWSEANVTRCGKNLFDESILLECSGWTESGGVYSGESAYVNSKYGNGVPNLKFKENTQYTFSFTYGQDGSAGIGLAIVMEYTDGTFTQKYCTLDTIGSISITSTSGKSVNKIKLSYGANRTIYLSNMQLEENTSATEFVPYNGKTVTIQFGQTVYGGELDVTSGVLTVTKGYIASYNGETLPSTWISDRDVYAEGTTPTTGAEVCYELATPTTISLTPLAIRSLLGSNNIFADTGNINEVKCFEKEV